MRAALPLRLRPTIAAYDDGKYYWLKGEGDVGEIERFLRCIPDIQRYTVAADNSITPLGRRIPAGDLPPGPWTPLSSVVQFSPQPGAMPAQLAAPVAVRLVRTEPGPEQAPVALVASIENWADYVHRAPQVRLDPLRFAISGISDALILGSPLPALQANYFSNHDGLLVPSGYAWLPRVEPQILRRAMHLAPHDLALFDTDGGYELIPAESIVPASRSAARRSLASYLQSAGAP
jgi:hypothetical protein